MPKTESIQFSRSFSFSKYVRCKFVCDFEMPKADYALTLVNICQPWTADKRHHLNIHTSISVCFETLIYFSSAIVIETRICVSLSIICLRFDGFDECDFQNLSKKIIAREKSQIVHPNMASALNLPGQQNFFFSFNRRNS